MLPERGYFVYAYVIDNEIVYVGKTVKHPWNRFREHCRDWRNHPDLQKAMSDVDRVFVIECKNAAEMNFCEKAYISTTLPVFNRAERNGVYTEEDIPELPFTMFTPAELRFDCNKIWRSIYSDPKKVQRMEETFKEIFKKEGLSWD